MNTKEIIEALQPIAQKLGQGAEQLFRIYVKQAIIDGILSLVFGIPILILSVYLIILAFKKIDDWEEGSFFLALISFIVAVICLFTVIGGLSNLLNPQYHALHNIITDVTNTSK